METFEPTQIEEEIFQWLNKLRTDPKSLVPILQERYQTFKDKAFKKGDKWFQTREGDVAVKEAFEFLKEHPPLKPIEKSEGLTRAAREHCDDMSRNGVTGHTGTGGSTMAQRIEKQGRWKGGVSENVAFQQLTGLDFILYWVVDDGMASRADRKNLFNPAFGVCGIAVGTHPKFKTCAVLVLTGQLTEGASGREATKQLNEYEKNGFDQFGVNNQMFGFKNMQAALQKDMEGDLKLKWVDGAVSVRHDKNIIKDGDKEKTVITYYYTMGDGSIREVVKEFDGIVENV